MKQYLQANPNEFIYNYNKPQILINSIGDEHEFSGNGLRFRWIWISILALPPSTLLNFCKPQISSSGKWE